MRVSNHANLWLPLVLFLIVNEYNGSIARGAESGSALPHNKPEARQGEHLLTVSGHGEVSAPPDKASVQLAVEGQAETATKAQDAANSTMHKIIGALKQLKIPDQQVRTLGLALSPLYAAPKLGQESEPPRVIGYRSSNTIRVEVNDPALVGQVVDRGVSAGAHRLGGVSFELKNESEYRARALQEAAKDAELKAQALAQTLDLKLISICRLQEGPLNVARPPFPLAKTARMAPTPVEAGNIKIDASVTVQYEIRPGQRSES